MKRMCRLAEVRENLMPIIEEMRKKRRFNEPNDFTIGDPEKKEKLSVVLRDNNLPNSISATILFENILLEILSNAVNLDFQIILKLGYTDDIDIYDLELLLIPTPILQDHNESEVGKEIIKCWNTALT
jgi:hypothetical protein